MTRMSERKLRLLGLFAHPDDEVFCIGGTFAQYAAEGAETMVVSFTRGEAGQIRDADIATRRTLGDVRSVELVKSCAALGVQQYRCLDFGDGLMSNVPFDDMVEAAVEIIREFQPDLVFTFDESGAYEHPDHIKICEVTTLACELAGNPDSYPDLLQPHSPSTLYYAYFPQNDRLLLKLLADWSSSLDQRFRGSDEFTHALMLFADESSMLGYASDHLRVEWYPSRFYIIEQGEPAVDLYLILSGSIDIFVEEDDGSMRFVETHGPGVFIGETGIAYGARRNAHCISAENTTCLVFSPGEPTNFAGRGEGAQYAVEVAESSAETPSALNVVDLDVSAFLMQKVEAMAAHRSQYPITRDLLPKSILLEILGKEHFIPAWQASERPAAELVELTTS